MALIDCGLMASIQKEDRDNMISAVIHLANKDYANLVDDFIKLKILPEDTNRPAVIPLMDKALSPYVKGGGAKKYEEELRCVFFVCAASRMNVPEKYLISLPLLCTTAKSMTWRTKATCNNKWEDSKP